MGITKIIVITDVGEEIDDEVTLWYLDKVFANRKDVTIDVLFVNGHMQSSTRLKRAKDLKLNEKEKLRYYQFLEYYYTFNKNERIIIVQIGPVEFIDNNKAKIEEFTKNPFEYILLGDVGTTLNSQNNAKATAEKFIEKSKKHYIVNSKINGELKVPSFIHDKIQMFPDVLKEEIYKLGFKNTVGRAPKIPFTRHLSGKGGANYEAVNEIYNIVNNNNNDISTLDVPKEFEISANEYMDMNQYPSPSQQETAKDFARKNNQEINNQASDLAKMTYALKHLGFQPDHKIIYSDAIIDKTTKNIDPQYTDSFYKYKNLLKEHPSIKMTPAYDLVAGYLVYLLCCKNDSIIYDKFEKNKTNNYMYYTLKDYSNIGNILDPGKLGKCFRNEAECIKYISNNIESLSFNDRNKIPPNLTTLNYAQLNTIVKMINQQSGGSQTYTKTNKKFTYNNRNYVVYKYTKSKKEFIKIKGIETQTSSLKKQEYKNTKQKIEYKGKPYSIFEKLADKRRFILVNNKRSYLKTR